MRSDSPAIAVRTAAPTSGKRLPTIAPLGVPSSSASAISGPASAPRRTTAVSSRSTRVIVRSSSPISPRETCTIRCEPSRCAPSARAISRTCRDGTATKSRSVSRSALTSLVERKLAECASSFVRTSALPSRPSARLHSTTSLPTRAAAVAIPRPKLPPPTTPTRSVMSAAPCARAHSRPRRGTPARCASRRARGDCRSSGGGPGPRTRPLRRRE